MLGVVGRNSQSLFRRGQQLACRRAQAAMRGAMAVTATHMPTPAAACAQVHH